MYIAIAEVNPAKNNKKNQTAPNILPPVISANTFGNAINASPILPFIPSVPRNAYEIGITEVPASITSANSFNDTVATEAAT